MCDYKTNRILKVKLMLKIALAFLMFNNFWRIAIRINNFFYGI